jgi:hypothetical protein
MKRILALAFPLIASASLLAQDAAQLAAQRDAEERERRTNARMQELENANNIYSRRMNELINENKALYRQLTDLENRFRNSQVGAVSRDDLRKAYDKMGEIDKARLADRALMLEQFKKIQEAVERLAERPPQYIQTPVPAVTPKNTVKPEPKPEKEPEAAPDNPNGYFTYTIKSGDNLLSIIKAFNTELKDKNKKPITLDQVKKANPKMNANNLQLGKEILIPVPPDK